MVRFGGQAAEASVAPASAIMNATANILFICIVSYMNCRELQYMRQLISKNTDGEDKY
jgi:hypothetical protein